MLRLAGGGGGIRTHETLSGLTVFKTAGVNRFPSPPYNFEFNWQGRVCQLVESKINEIPIFRCDTTLEINACWNYFHIPKC
jgi:hypothetical protein